jgi:hypothetical protein
VSPHWIAVTSVPSFSTVSDVPAAIAIVGIATIAKAIPAERNLPF